MYIPCSWKDLKVYIVKYFPSNLSLFTESFEVSSNLNETYETAGFLKINTFKLWGEKPGSGRENFFNKVTFLQKTLYRTNKLRPISYRS